MLFNIHKVYTIYDYGQEGQMVLEIEKQQPEVVDITAGRRNELLGVVEGSTADYTPEPKPLIDANSGFRFSVDIKESSAIYIYLEPGYILDQLQVSPESVDQDLLLEEFNSETRLIYCFFAISAGQLTIRGNKTTDNSVLRKLLQSRQDIFLRRVLLERMSFDFKKKLLSNKDFLNVDDIANYLSLSKGTIQNKVSQGKFLRPLDIGGTKVWDKKELLEWIRKQR